MTDAPDPLIVVPPPAPPAVSVPAEPPVAAPAPVEPVNFVALAEKTLADVEKGDFKDAATDAEQAASVAVADLEAVLARFAHDVTGKATELFAEVKALAAKAKTAI